MRPTEPGGVSRRSMIGGGAAIGLLSLTGCGNGGGQGGGGKGAGTPSEDKSPTGSGGAPTDGLVPLEDVPVGEAVSAETADGKPIIVTQPTAGEVAAFSAICTHRGCTVAPEGGILKCPCHGSTFDATTGENTGGPAPEPLPEVTVTVVDGMVREA
jgi:cytochrome b6-f complex iron-sulfur subunit